VEYAKCAAAVSFTEGVDMRLARVTRWSAAILGTLLLAHLTLRLAMIWEHGRDHSCPTLSPGVVFDTWHSADLRVWPRDRCTATTLDVVAGGRYRVDVVLPRPCTSRELELPPAWRGTGQWSDGALPVAGPAGVTTGESLRARSRGVVALAALPFRRDLDLGWLAPTLLVAERQRVPLTAASTEFVAAASGRLEVRVNDAVVPFLAVDAAFENNAGGPARVHVERVAAAAAPGGPLPPFTCEEQAQLWAARGAAVRNP
jgi:hypothetical protein